MVLAPRRETASGRDTLASLRSSAQGRAHGRGVGIDRYVRVARLGMASLYAGSAASVTGAPRLFFEDPDFSRKIDFGSPAREVARRAMSSPRSRFRLFGAGERTVSRSSKNEREGDEP
jgi:hypothetical protein